ncbi:MAG: hypothetical protein ACI8XO_004889 [Verrucomicrobiales bacterium]
MNFAVTLTLGLFTQKAPQEVQDMVESIHVPTGSGDASGH